jgi:hypothetical protein
MDPRQEISRADPRAKCANCGWWQGGDGHIGMCEHHNIKTLDLATCTGWREVAAPAEILKPEDR